MFSNLLKRQILSRNAMISTSCMRSSSSIVSAKVKHFNDASSTWWDPNGPMKYMHLVHPHQVSFVRQQLGLKRGIQPETTTHQPLTGYQIADVGCGVGMNSEGLALLGAEVTGLDPAEKTIEVATAHAASNPKLEGRLKYLVSTAEDHVLTHSGQYDAVMAFFILEHIENRQEFIDNCLALLKPGGFLFLGHCNRSYLWIFYMLWSKYVSRLIITFPLLSHRTFLTTEEVMAMVNKSHPLELKGQLSFYWTLSGQSFRPINSKRFAIFSHFDKRN